MKHLIDAVRDDALVVFKDTHNVARDVIEYMSAALEARATAPLINTIPFALAAPAPNCEADVKPVNGIRATHRHGEGAIARCFYCGRYSLDPKTLSDRQPKCDCGEKHGWSGSFKKPGASAQWSGAAPKAVASGDGSGIALPDCSNSAKTGAPVARAAVAPQPAPRLLNQLRRFNECCEDFEASGHDVEKDDLRALADLGAVRPAPGGRHYITDFGRYLLAAPTPTVAADAGAPKFANLEGMRAKLLAPRAIVRDEHGWLCHAAYPVFGEGTRADKFLEALSIEPAFVSMESDSPDFAERWHEEALDNCSEWTPTPPAGDGWLLLEIYDTEDGPYAMFGRDQYEAENALKRHRTLELSERIQQRQANQGDEQ